MAQQLAAADKKKLLELEQKQQEMQQEVVEADQEKEIIRILQKRSGALRRHRL